MSFAYHLDGTALCKEVVNHVLFPVEGDVIIFKPHLTAGGGDCAMHALCGEVSNGIYYLHNPREYLMHCFEGDFDLRNSTWGRWKSSKFEFSEKVIILSHGTFSLEDLNKYSRLVILVG